MGDCPLSIRRLFARQHFIALGNHMDVKPGFNGSTLTEKQLIEDCLKGNARSQRRLFQRFAGKMMTVCRRYAYDQTEAEDMLQDAFIKVFTHLDQYRFEGSLEGWIRRIVVHCALKALQKKRIRFTDLALETEALPSPDAGALSAMSAAELLKLISALPDGYRVVFNLYVIEGYDHNEIAALLDISPATSRSQLLKARRALRDQIIENKRLPNQYAS
jgi:RNA polymerase sigma factor (sigma-70 family)